MLSKLISQGLTFCFGTIASLRMSFKSLRLRWVFWLVFGGPSSSRSITCSRAWSRRCIVLLFITECFINKVTFLRLLMISIKSVEASSFNSASLNNFCSLSLFFHLEQRHPPRWFAKNKEIQSNAVILTFLWGWIAFRICSLKLFFYFIVWIGLFPFLNNYLSSVLAK